MRVMFGAVLGCLLWSTTVFAQQATEDVEAQQGISQPAPASDVRVIFDVSGSMRENDPERLSASALELLASLLPADSRGGLWLFGERVENPLPVGPVDRRWRERARSLAPALVDYQQYTDIEAAIRAASEAPGGERHLVLLTDGVIDLEPAGGSKSVRDARSRRVLLEELAPTLADRGVTIHAIAFSPQADLALVERLAQSSQGLAALAQTPEDLLRGFIDIFERIFPTDQVPLGDNRFPIDPEVESFSALLFHEPDAAPPVLVGPGGRRYTPKDLPAGASWQRQPRFDLITVPSPEEGEWRIEGELEDDSRVSVISPLVLKTSDLPATLYQGFDLPVEAWLDREDDASLTSGQHQDMRVTVELQALDGSVLAESPLTQTTSGNARFSGVLPAPSLTGNARLVIDAEGASVHRQRVQAVNVLPAISARREAGQVWLEAEHPALNASNTRLSATLQGESLPIEAFDERRWRVTLPELPAELGVPLLLEAEIDLAGESRALHLPRLLLNPDGRILLDEARLDGAELTSRDLPATPGEAVTPTGSDGFDADGAADRVVGAINALPGKARQLVRGLGDQPRSWLVGVALGMALAILALWGLRARRLRQQPRQPSRQPSQPHPRRHSEEPHV
ncbi:vWA domain-containing protein [Halomonas sp. YLGW01]|uniref:vWA domain-containing protein n=1 Tax=Halomonas sp. YLGW01 TaxID=2773308 RepID=UPI0017833795|nr:vWA domain-containing protein [Halomonas sp. YLGW01]